MKFYKVCILLAMFGFSQFSSAQAEPPGAQSAIQSGTIDKTREDDGYITISGWDYGFDDEITRVFYSGEEVGVEILASGIIVRYTLDRNNILLTVEIVGPHDAIASLEDS